MHRILAGSIIFLVLSSQVFSQTPVLHYTFDEVDGDALDQGSGDPANGELLADAARTNNTPGGFSPFALDLSAEGLESWVNGGDAAKVDSLTQFTMTTWINLQGLNADQGGSGNVRLLAKQTDGAFDGFSWNLNNPLDGERSPSNFRLGMFIGGDLAFGFGQSTESLGADDRWVFLAATYDGTEDLDNLSFYVGDETDTVELLGLPLSVFAGQVNSSEGRATVNIGFTDAAPGVDFSINGYQDDVRIYNSVLSVEQLDEVRLANLGPTLVGDLNGDGVIDATDIDSLAQAIRDNDSSPKFDVNGDGQVDANDHQHFISNNANTWVGDSNFDGEFNSSDFVAVFAAGLYETAQPATWGQGDWNGDGFFDSGDFVFAFGDGGYELGPRGAQAQAVPEPSFYVFLMGLLPLLIRRKR